MGRQKKNIKKTRKKSPGKRRLFSSVGSLFGCLFLLLLLVFSLCSAGYIIFFRVAQAQVFTASLTEIGMQKSREPGVPVRSVPRLLQGLSETDPQSVKASVLPKVAIIIDDMGYGLDLGRMFLDETFAKTFAFLPFAPYTKELEREAHLRGKTVFLHLPLQSQSDIVDPGPGVLLLSDPPKIKRKKLCRCLSEVPHAVGVNNHMGSLFTENWVSTKVVMRELKNRSLVFVDSVTTSRSVAYKAAKDFAVPSARRDIFLDNILSREHICGQLAKLVGRAKRHGFGVGIAHPHTITFDSLKACSAQYVSEVEFVSVMDVL